MADCNQEHETDVASESGEQPKAHESITSLPPAVCLENPLYQVEEFASPDGSNPLSPDKPDDGIRDPTSRASASQPARSDYVPEQKPSMRKTSLWTKDDLVEIHPAYPGVTDLAQLDAIINTEVSELLEEMVMVVSGERTDSPLRSLLIGKTGLRERKPKFSSALLDSESVQPTTPSLFPGQIEDQGELAESIIVPQEATAYDRQELLEMYNAQLEKREYLLKQNHQLQAKLAQHFRKKKIGVRADLISDDTKKHAGKEYMDQEQRYAKYLSRLDELQTTLANETESYTNYIAELSKTHERLQEEVDKMRETFMQYRNDVAARAINSHTGRPIPPKELEAYQQREKTKDADLFKIRLEYIKLKNKLALQEEQLKTNQVLAEGLHLVDFEQLKLENQALNEKIEERNEELIKLKKKITNTVMVITHVKEKLDFINTENEELQEKLNALETQVEGKRDLVTQNKQRRDFLRTDHVKINKKAGLLLNRDLQYDYEDRFDRLQRVEREIAELQARHAEDNLKDKALQQKINQVKAKFT